jgi:putative hemolysin
VSENHWLTISVVIVCAIFSFFLSGMEAGVFAVNRLRIRQLRRRGNRRAAVLLRFLEQPEDFLWTILVGNILVNFVFFSLLVIGLFDVFHGRIFWPALIFLLVVFVFFSLCELLPKMLFRAFPNRLSLMLVNPFRFVHWGLTPLVALIKHSSRALLRWTQGRQFTPNVFGNREELRFVMQESAHGLTSEERAMINRVLDLQHLTVGSLMIPMSRTVSVRENTPVAEIVRLCRETGLTRLVVFDREGTRVTGVVSGNSIIYQSEGWDGKTAADFLKPAPFLGEDLRLEEALKRMQRAGRRLAVVVTRDNKEIGILGLQDILKVIFGEVRL